MTDDQYEWVDLREASRRLGRSTETIRRQIRAGIFEYPAEREQRGPGDTRDRYKVRLPMAPERPVATPHEALRPLIDALDQEREERRRLAAQIADLRERAGRAETRAEAESARASEAVRRFEDEREKRMAEASEVGSSRADAFIARVERDQAVRERDDLAERLRRAEAETAALKARRWYDPRTW